MWIFLYNKLSLLFGVFFPSLDPEQKDQLIEVIEKLLADKTTVGSCNIKLTPHVLSSLIFLTLGFRFFTKTTDIMDGI